MTVNADSYGRVVLEVANKNISNSVGISRDKIGRFTVEGDEAAIATNRGDVAGPICRISLGIDADQSSHSCLTITNKDGGARSEGKEATIFAQGGELTLDLVSLVVNTNQFRHTGLAIMGKGVSSSRAARDQVGGLRAEADYSAVSTNVTGSTATAPNPLIAIAVDALPRRRSRLPMVDKNVPPKISIRQEEVCGVGEEGDEVPALTDHWRETFPGIEKGVVDSGIAQADPVCLVAPSRNRKVTVGEK